MVEGWFYTGYYKCKNMLILKVNTHLNCEDLCKENDHLATSIPYWTINKCRMTYLVLRVQISIEHIKTA